MQNIYIGQIIEQRLKELNISIKDFADMIGYHRTSVYSIFKQKSIDTELLRRISKILDYDFYNKVYGSGNKEKKQQLGIESPPPDCDMENVNIPPGLLLFVEKYKMIITESDLKDINIPSGFLLFVKKYNKLYKLDVSIVFEEP